MTILSGDIKLVASQVMNDVAEGGGAPTSTVILDAVSNSVFPDISELDRAIGRVNMRKLFVHVQTDNVDSYLGANVIIAEPFADPNVSCAIVQVDNFFSRRTEAKGRVEAYLAPGPVYAGYLFGDMLQGQRTVTLCQRAEAPLPNIGDRIILTKFADQPTTATQFVAVTQVTSSVRVFTDDSGEFPRRIVILSIGDSLTTDFPGFNAQRQDPAFEALKAKTGLYEAVVADAARYYGAVPLVEPIAIGDFNIKAAGIYTKIVPSAQVETPLADVRTNGLSMALVATGADVVQSLTLAWSTTQSLFVGGGILPGSLSVVRDGITITDAGGTLRQAATEVGAVDYDNGILVLSVDVFGSSGGEHSITYTPAAPSPSVDRSVGIPITINNRSLTYVVTLYPPARRSLRVSYMAGGTWYVLTEDGSGKVVGSDITFGIGTLNFSTGTLALTLGALPDSGSALILQWAEEQTALLTQTGPSAPGRPNTSLRMGGRLYAPINTSGEISEAAGAKKITPSSLTLTWDYLGTKTATDNGNGVLSGDAIGIVDYQRGVVLFSPNVLPADDTVVSFTQTTATANTSTGLTWAGSGLVRTASLPPNLTAGTVSFGIQLGSTTGIVGNPEFFAPGRGSVLVEGTVVDNGSGGLRVFGLACGTVDYTSGLLTLDLSAHSNAAIIAAAGFYTDVVRYDNDPTLAYGPDRIGDASVFGVTVSWSSVNLVPYTTATFADTAAATDPISVMVTRYITRLDYLAEGYTLQGAGFELGGSLYRGNSTGSLITNISPATGIGTPVGSVNSLTGAVSLETWTPGVSSLITQWTGYQAPPVTGVGDMSGNISVVMRTATAPIRPGSYSLLGTMSDGTALNVTAGIDGKINHARVKGRINYETGVVELVFCRVSASDIGELDVSYLGIVGVSTINLDTVVASTLRYNAVSYTYIPLDSSIIGVDSVRLPSDGRVPIIRAGSVVVVGNTASVTATVSNAQVINCARTRLSRVRVIGNDGLVINTGYSTDLEAGTVTFSDVTGYAQPVKVEHRIEDMAVVADAQINGDLRLTRPMTHVYPTTGSYVSSALILGDTFTRVSTLFDQQTWDAISWSDVVDGDPATGTYNDVLAPIIVTNAGAVTERWALRFTSTSAFQIIGEHVGVIGTGTINADCSPINPVTSAPYFTVLETGWGAGWSVGNILRLNTVGSMFPVWLVRTVQQGIESVVNDSFTLLVRGDVDRP